MHTGKSLAASLAPEFNGRQREVITSGTPGSAGPTSGIYNFVTFRSTRRWPALGVSGKTDRRFLWSVRSSCLSIQLFFGSHLPREGAERLLDGKS